MAAHRFKVGQTVNLQPGRDNSTTISRSYKIVRLLPAQDGHLQYRIKGSSEAFERVAKESDISLG